MRDFKVNQSAPAALRSLSLSPVPSHLEWGYHSIIRFLCGDYAGAIEACDRAHGVIKTLPAWRAAALHELGEEYMARTEAQRFLNAMRSFWIGLTAPTDEEITRWLLQAHPVSVNARWQTLRRALSGAGLPVENIPQTA